MKRTAIALVAAGAALVGSGALAQDADRGAEGYKLCASCHGFQGQGNQLVGAPRLAGLEGWYLERQIRHFRDGVRGMARDDTSGQQMARMTAGLTDEQDIADIVAYIGTLPAHGSAATVDGDSARGKTQYAPCAACHGDRAQGNAMLNAPALAGTDDWYQLSQLMKFRAGQRGASAADTFGQQMAPMAAVLPDEQAMRDVVAYINTLQEPVAR